MKDESKEFLKELLHQCGPSGFEEEAQSVWCNRTSKYADHMNRDVMGNSVAILNKDAKFRIMLAGHCDEIGFIITNISDEGFLYVEPIGGIDRKVIAGSSVLILGNKTRTEGVIGKKAIHLEEDDDKGKALKIKDAFIDIGANNKKDAQKVVAVGDAVSFTPNYTELRNGIFSSKGCDDKVGAFVVSEVIKILSKKRNQLKVGVWSTATVQEEVGLRGATTSAFGINPDVAFAVDVGFASDTPHSNKNELGDIQLGKGGVIHPGPSSNKVLYNLVKKTANKNKIPYQIQAYGSTDGTDAGAMQLSRNGTATVLLSIPNRYMHTQVETCAFKDLENTAKLIAETILKIKPDMSFIPTGDYHG